MNEKEVQVFIAGSRRYFDTVTERIAEIGTPYLTSPAGIPVSDYTGIIGISGARRGCVLISAPRIMLHHLLMSMGERDISEELVRDSVGELANTIAGNARSEFGAGFMISVPVVVKGKPDEINIPAHLRAFNIPVQWQSYAMSLTVCLE
ncbi:MAG TPA: chemotaxis protein CheX [Pseudomonadales bacterium]|nr:chemotaxis protein CheX [Pseudomonadales bacterium]